jgi:hypothetical protein
MISYFIDLIDLVSKMIFYFITLTEQVTQMILYLIKGMAGVRDVKRKV